MDYGRWGQAGALRGAAAAYGTAVRDVLIVCPSSRDLAAAARARVNVHLVGGDADSGRFDPDEILRAAAELRVDGVVGSKDRAALLAALVAAEQGLPGPTPEAVLRCQYKPTSRALQRAAAPEAVPPFAVIAEGRAPLPPPFFVKPVVGRLSQGSFRLDELAQLPRRVHDDYRASFERMAAVAGFDDLDFDGHLAEGVLEGLEVTLEGYVHEGRVVTIGITDSVNYPGTQSFQRFEYPTRLPPARRAELDDVTRRVLPALGFDGGFFNVEFVVPERGPAQIVEVNARLATQFAPLLEAVHGRSSYDALFTLACGDDPAWEPCEPGGVAVSWVIRVFTDAFVDAVPAPEPGLELLVEPGRPLSAQGLNDPESFRLAIFAEAAPTREEALARCRRRADELLARFVLRPV
jgi:hypothetical protein